MSDSGQSDLVDIPEGPYFVWLQVGNSHTEGVGLAVVDWGAQVD